MSSSDKNLDLRYVLASACAAQNMAQMEVRFRQFSRYWLEVTFIRILIVPGQSKSLHF